MPDDDDHRRIGSDRLSDVNALPIYRMVRELFLPRRTFLL